MKTFGVDAPTYAMRGPFLKTAVLALRKEIARHGLTLKHARRRRRMFEMDGEEIEITSIEVLAVG